MDLIAEYPEFRLKYNDFYWECFSCGCCIPAHLSFEEMEALLEGDPDEKIEENY